jgi:hypothetical protein
MKIDKALRNAGLVTLEQQVGAKFIFPDTEYNNDMLRNGSLPDITLGKEYQVFGEDDGELFFIDDAGDKNFAGMNHVGNGEVLLAVTIEDSREDQLEAVVKQLADAMKEAMHVGCVDHLDCAEDGGDFWYNALDRASEILAK